MNNKSNRRLALEASIFTVLGYGFSQIIRLVNNMVLTRLLIPEYFGIVSIANVLIMGVNLLSDIGLGPSVIRSNKTDDEKFINTVWTVQIIRGVIIACITLIIASPISIYYQEPQLRSIISLVGLLALIQGFFSINTALYNKELRQGILSIIELSSQLISSIIGIIVAYITKSIWALVIISYVGVFIHFFCGHFILKTNIKPRLIIEKKYLKEILHFGKWIFFATAMTFLSGQIDKMLLGKLLSFVTLGIFNIAIMFSELIKQVLQQLSAKVLFPLFSRNKNLTRDQFRMKMIKPRRLLLLAIGFLVIILTCFGDYVITILYDERYYDAAWMLPILALGMWPYVLYISHDSCLYVIGKPQYLALGNLVKFVYMIISIPIIHNLFGLLGVIIAIAVNDIPSYLVINWGYMREKLSMLRDDFISTLILLLAITIIIYLRYLFILELPWAYYYK